MKDNISKAFDFAADLTKQLITLATALLAFTVTFVKDKGDPGDGIQNWILISSWIFLIISIAMGLLTLMALTGNLDPIPPKIHPKAESTSILTITSKNVTDTSKLQVFTFMIAIVLTSISGMHMLFHKATPEQQKVIIIHHQGADTVKISSGK